MTIKILDSVHLVNRWQTEDEYEMITKNGQKVKETTRRYILREGFCDAIYDYYEKKHRRLLTNKEMDEIDEEIESFTDTLIREIDRKISYIMSMTDDTDIGISEFGVTETFADIDCYVDSHDNRCNGIAFKLCHFVYRDNDVFVGDQQPDKYERETNGNELWLVIRKQSDGNYVITTIMFRRDKQDYETLDVQFAIDFCNFDNPKIVYRFGDEHKQEVYA